MADIERKYADLIFRASRKYPSWDPEIPVRCGDYGRITLGRPAWMFWRRRLGVFVKEGNIYDNGKAKDWDIPEPSGEHAQDSDGLTWVTSENSEEIDIYSAVSCQTPAILSCKVRAAFKFSSSTGAVLVMVNDTITSIEPATSLRHLLDDESMKGLVIVSQVHRCASYARLLTGAGTKVVALGLSAETPAGEAGAAQGETKWVRSVNTGNFKTRVNKSGSRDFYPLFKLMSIINSDVSSGLRGGDGSGDDPLPDAEPPWPSTAAPKEPSSESADSPPQEPGGSSREVADPEHNNGLGGKPSLSRWWKPRLRVPFLS